MCILKMIFILPPMMIFLAKWFNSRSSLNNIFEKNFRSAFIYTEFLFNYKRRFEKVLKFSYKYCSIYIDVESKIFKNIHTVSFDEKKKLLKI